MRQPNIMVILADDLGFSDIGCFGSEISTSNLDRLARDGVSFTQMYNCARCCPSRASLLTGLYPHQAGVGHMVDDEGVPAYQGYLNRNCVTIAEALKTGGYAAGMSGKWHVGGSYGTAPDTRLKAGDERHPLPRQRGFDRFYGTLAGAGSYYRPHTLMLDDEFVDTAGDDSYYYTDAISRHAAGMVEQFHAEDRPFFMYVAYTAPHWPLHALEEDVVKYRRVYRAGWDEIRRERYERLVRTGIIGENWRLSGRHEGCVAWEAAGNREWEIERMAVYATQIERMDRGIGLILDKLRELGIEDDTMTVFLSDNGGCHEELDGSEWLGRMVGPTRAGMAVAYGNDPSRMPGGEDTYMSYGVAWANVSNTPFRMFKHWVHEGGIATPMIVHWPAGPAATGRIVREPCHAVDLMATCLDAAGIAYPREYGGRPLIPPEGRSLLPAIAGEALPEKPIFWEHEGNRAVRLGRWKLVCKQSEGWELYDMERDRTELSDIATEYPEQVSLLRHLYEQWAVRCGVDSRR